MPSPHLRIRQRNEIGGFWGESNGREPPPGSNCENDPSAAADDDENDSTGSYSGGYWSQETHRAFVEAMFVVGLSSASPSIILDGMENNADINLTNERVKSHLQKFRISRAKNTEQFMKDYDAWLRKAIKAATTGAEASATASNSAEAHEHWRSGPGDTEGNNPMKLDIENLSGAELAAFLTYSAMLMDETGVEVDPGDEYLRPVSFHQKVLAESGITLPVLSKEEAETPLGHSITRIIGLMESIPEYLSSKERQKRKDTIAAKRPPEAKRVAAGHLKRNSSIDEYSLAAHACNHFPPLQASSSSVGTMGRGEPNHAAAAATAAYISSGPMPATVPSSSLPPAYAPPAPMPATVPLSSLPPRNSTPILGSGVAHPAPLPLIVPPSVPHWTQQQQQQQQQKCYANNNNDDAFLPPSHVPSNGQVPETPNITISNLPRAHFNGSTRENYDRSAQH